VPASRMCRTIPPLSQYAFMAWCSVKAQGQFYLTFTTNSISPESRLSHTFSPKTNVYVVFGYFIIHLVSG